MAKAKQSSRPGTGSCRLTGKMGLFVGAHIIPRSLALPAPGGAPFAQIGNRTRPTRRRESWYDPNLVTAEGEAILTDYDDWGIKELRRLKLLWSSWGPMTGLGPSDFTEYAPGSAGFRATCFSDAGRMRLFLLSILWRAAASGRPEFAEVTLRASDFRRLRQAVRDGKEPPSTFLPITMTQLSTRGPAQNMGPIAHLKPVGIGALNGEIKRPVFRFYFDGLILYFHRDSSDATLEALWPMLVGKDAETVVPTIPYEMSWQHENLLNSIADADHEFPGFRDRAAGIKPIKERQP